MEMLLMYLWLKLDDFRHLFGTTALVMGVICLCCLFYGVVEEGEFRIKNISKKLWTTFVLCILLANFLPTQKDAAYIVGAHYAVMAAESPEAQKIVTIMREKANEFLDDQLKEVKK